MLLMGVASGCNWAETLSAWLRNGFQQAASAGKVFLGGKFVMLAGFDSIAKI